MVGSWFRSLHNSCGRRGPLWRGVSGLAGRNKMPSEQPSTFEFLGGLLGQHLVFLRIQKEWLEAGLHLGHLGSPKNLGFDLKKVMGCWTTESALVHPSTSRPWAQRSHEKVILPLHGEQSMHRSWRMPKIPQAMQPQGNFINPNSPQLSPRDMESIEWFRLLLIILGYLTGGVKDWQRVQSLCYPLGSSSMISKWIP